MKITKYLHSCLLVEEQGKIFLIDPGNYSVENEALTIEKLNHVDYLLITHEHPDHMYLPFIKELTKKFQNIQTFSNNSVKQLLEKENITVQTESTDIIKLSPVPHEKIWMGQSPQNCLIAINNQFADPGDSLTFSTSAPIIALPITAPWGSTTWAVETALKIKPKIIIPIHDYQWKEEFKKGIYERLEQYFEQLGISFKKMETGISVEV